MLNKYFYIISNHNCLENVSKFCFILFFKGQLCPEMDMILPNIVI